MLGVPTWLCLAGRKEEKGGGGDFLLAPADVRTVTIL